MDVFLWVAGYLVVALAVAGFVAGSDKDNKIGVPLTITMGIIWVITVPMLIGAAFGIWRKNGRKP